MSSSIKQVKTRKDHICFGCGGQIPAGRTVEYFVNFIEDFSYGHICEVCEIYLELYSCSFDGEIWYEGDLNKDSEQWEDAANVFEKRNGISFETAISHNN